ncbi:MAG: tRNA 2-thiouridine(34) synthase MnmA [Deltaproteobacteria bacterium]|nr:MAG: tRNA 2-thiouridine(34) synthase MnmA [Deltaproteobacteria bacterium]
MAGKRPKVVAGLSGGVDSSVSCALLLDQGYEVIAVTMLMQPCDEDSGGKRCCGAGAVQSAGEVCRQLGIEHRVVDMRERFERQVLERAWRMYDSGMTPNPCVDCNRLVRFPVLADLAGRLGADMIATGHHAQTRMDPAGHVELVRGSDLQKDQSYFLYGVERRLLGKCIFPVGSMTKAKVRSIASERKLASADRPESQDICLEHLGMGFSELLRLRFAKPARRGEIVDEDGNVLARHDGIHRFTIGQRKGLGVGLGKPVYVASIDAKSAKVVVTSDARALHGTRLVAGEVSWFTKPSRQWRSAEAQIRYRHKPAECRFRESEGMLEVEFTSSQRAITPGQSVVIYGGDRVVCGGVIKEVGHGRG